MAHRRLCAVTFAVLGLLAAGCGGDTNTRVSGTDADQQPPTNQDQPPSNSDQVSSTDQAPSNPDQPVNGSEPAGTGSGGRLGGLCQDLCSSIEKLGDQCSKGMASMGDTKSLCSAGCQVPANVLPCEQQIADVFSCFIDNLQLLCAAVDNNTDQPAAGRDPQTTTSACQDALKSYATCAEAHGISDNTDNTAPKCSKAGGCDCPTDCTSCTCEAGTDQKKLTACSSACANP